MDFLSPTAQAYADRYVSSSDTILEELEAYTWQTHPKAHMLSGKVQGKFLAMISQMMSPTHILEIGTFTGYSAICLAKGLSVEGEVITIESRTEDAQTANSFFLKAGLQEKIRLIEGDAKAIIPALSQIWDLVFIDADKVSYIDYYRMVMPQLRSGGMIIADNVLFHGDVLEEPLKGKNAKAVQEFNDFVKADPAVDHVLLTVRDGLMLIRKK